jgi:eukaryotic-like serine/threonine-protein kinase
MDMTRGTGIGAENTLAAGHADYPSLVEISTAHSEITRELAHGGMGRIRVARDRRLGRSAAIKEVVVPDGELAQRFEREARIRARLQHPSIVAIYEAGVWGNGAPVCAMPPVEGRSFDEVIAEKRTLAERIALLPTAVAVADAVKQPTTQHVLAALSAQLAEAEQHAR